MMEAIRKTVIIAIVVFISGSALINSLGQIMTLWEAHNQNKIEIKEIEVLNNKEKELTYKIKVATDSVYIARELHDKLGLGSENDYWIKMPKEYSFKTVYPELTTTEEKANWKKWFDLFVE